MIQIAIDGRSFVHLRSIIAYKNSHEKKQNRWNIYKTEVNQLKARLRFSYSSLSYPASVLRFDNLSCTLWRSYPEKKKNLLYKCFTTCLTHSKGEPGFRKCQLNFYEHVTSLSFGAKQKTNLHCEAGWHVVCSLPQWTQGWYVVCSLPQWTHV